MATKMPKTRIQIPVSKELAAYVTLLGECLKWTQAATTAELLREGLKSREKIAEWVGERIMASVVSVVRGQSIAKGSDEPPIYIQAFVDKEVSDAIDRMATELKNTPARTAAMVLESAAFDNGWVIEALGSGPGQVVRKFFESVKAKSLRKKARPASSA